MSSQPRRREAAAALAGAVLLLTGCLYSFSGGGGLPDHIGTVYVPPAENETTRFALTERVTQGLLEAVRGRLGAQVASETNADAIVRVTLTSFADDAMSFEAREGEGAEVFQRRVTLSASAEIYDQVNDRPLWSSSSLRGTGEYAPEQENQDVGVELALENLIQKIVDGAQSQW